MSRSIKKGPFVQEALYKKVVAMNEAGEKKVLKTWSRTSIFSLNLSVTHLQFMTDASTFRFMLRKIW